MRITRRIRLRVGDTLLAINFQIWNVKIHDRVGITNIARDGKLIPFFDFQQEIPLEKIVESLRWRQNEFLLSDIYVIQSYPRLSFRAVCFDKVDWKTNLAILSNTNSLMRIISDHLLEGDSRSCGLFPRKI